VRAPEICVEVLSPSNTPEEMSEAGVVGCNSGCPKPVIAFVVYG
jgi:hypothetical protein